MEHKVKTLVVVVVVFVVTRDNTQRCFTTELHPQPFVYFDFETGSYQLARTDLMLAIFLPQSPNSLELQKCATLTRRNDYS